MFIQTQILAQIGFKAIMPSHLKAIKTQNIQSKHILPITNKLNKEQSKIKGGDVDLSYIKTTKEIAEIYNENGEKLQ
jgi:hypothetical protein